MMVIWLGGRFGRVSVVLVVVLVLMVVVNKEVRKVTQVKQPMAVDLQAGWEARGPYRSSTGAGGCCCLIQLMQ